jgi:hypothetical protein
VGGSVGRRVGGLREGKQGWVGGLVEAW